MLGENRQYLNNLNYQHKNGYVEVACWKLSFFVATLILSEKTGGSQPSCPGSNPGSAVTIQHSGFFQKKYSFVRIEIAFL
jgi:hypothetical protein